MLKKEELDKRQNASEIDRWPWGSRKLPVTRGKEVCAFRDDMVERLSQFAQAALTKLKNTTD